MTERACPEFLWFFDENRRIYASDRPSTHMPIWREHWRKVPVSGETRQSYILTRSVWYGGRDITRVNKKNMPPQFVFDEAGIDRAEWVYEHRHAIVSRVSVLRDADLLKQIGKLVDYDPA